MGHACVIFESAPALGGMMRYGIPGYRTPRDMLDGEIQRILDMGVEVRLNTRVGIDFLRAFNDGRLRYVGKRVIVVGGGDTSSFAPMCRVNPERWLPARAPTPAPRTHRAVAARC